MTDLAAPAVIDEHPLSLLEKAALVLDAFEGSAPRLTLTEVIQRSGLPRSSVHRILDQLVQLHWLDREGRDYRLGMRLLELGGLAAHHNRLRRAALPALHALHEQTGHLVHLAVLSGTDVLYLERIGGSDDALVPSRIGGRQPAYCTAAGKAILAWNTPEALNAVLRAGLPARTAHTITRPQRLHDELLRVRAHGAAYDREEGFRGVTCVAAPLRGAGHAVAAVSVTGYGLHRELERLTPVTQAAARSIWRSMFGPGRHPEPPHRSAPARATRPPTIPHAALQSLLAWPRHTDWM